MPFEEFAQNKDNFEFVKDFNQMNENRADISVVNAAGDRMLINKGFLHSIMDSDDIENG